MKRFFRLSAYACIILLFVSIIPLTSYATSDTEKIIDWENYLQPANQRVHNRLIGVEFHLFTMEASRLSSLLSTHGTSKYFYGSSIPNTATMYYCGKLTTYNGADATAGICYRSSTGYLHSVHETTFESGVWRFSENISASRLNDNEKYLGYIDGRGTGETYGSIQFWYLNY